MITYLNGELSEIIPGRLTIDVNGIGYEVLVPLSTSDKMPDKGEKLLILTHLHIREQEHTLQIQGTLQLVCRHQQNHQKYTVCLDDETQTPAWYHSTSCQEEKDTVAFVRNMLSHLRSSASLLCHSTSFDILYQRS